MQEALQYHEGLPLGNTAPANYEECSDASTSPPEDQTISPPDTNNVSPWDQRPSQLNVQFPDQEEDESSGLKRSLASNQSPTKSESRVVCISPPSQVSSFLSDTNIQ